MPRPEGGNNLTYWVGASEQGGKWYEIRDVGRIQILRVFVNWGKEYGSLFQRKPRSRHLKSFKQRVMYYLIYILKGVP